MSGVARYHAETASPHPQGAFVLYEDYAALLERIAALEGDAARMKERCLAAIIRDCPSDGSDYELFTRRAYERVAALDAARVGCKHERLQSLDCLPPHVSCMDCGETVDAARVGG